MKKIIVTAIAIATSISCKAQNQVLPLQDWGSLENSTGVYYKDINHYLDNFVGTYVYTSGSWTFTLKLKKIIKSTNGYLYTDLLVGAYEYKNGNTVIASTFPDPNSYSLDTAPFYRFDAYDLRVNSGDWYGCTQCDPNAVWLVGSIYGMTTETFYRIYLKRLVYNGQQALVAKILIPEFTSRKEGDPIPTPKISSFPAMGMDFILITDVTQK